MLRLRCRVKALSTTTQWRSDRAQGEDLHSPLLLLRVIHAQAHLPPWSGSQDTILTQIFPLHTFIPYKSEIRQTLIHIPALPLTCSVTFNSVQFSHSVVSNSLWPHGLYPSRLPCPSQTPGTYSNSCPLSWWCRPTISSSVVPLTFCSQSFPASGPWTVWKGDTLSMVLLLFYSY